MDHMCRWGAYRNVTDWPVELVECDTLPALMWGAMSGILPVVCEGMRARCGMVSMGLRTSVDVDVMVLCRASTG